MTDTSDTSDTAIEALRSDIMSQVGDDVQKMFDHEALFKRTAAMLTALQAERQSLRTAVAYWHTAHATGRNEPLEIAREITMRHLTPNTEARHGDTR